MRDFLAHLRRLTDQHAILIDQIVKGELAHLGAMFVVRPVGFRFGNANAGSAVARASAEFSPT